MRLEHVDIAHWAGLGGVRYIPSDFVDKLEKEGDDGNGVVDPEQVRRNLLDNVKAENSDIIDHRNIQLVQKLRSSDSAFSLGEGRKCEKKRTQLMTTTVTLLFCSRWPLLHPLRNGEHGD